MATAHAPKQGAANDNLHHGNDNHPAHGGADGQKRYDIIGGGISGLSTAYYLIKQGVPASAIHVHEASGRFGGKILSAQLDGKVVNRGAEFIDSTQEGMLAMCKDLGVKLNKSDDQGTLEFQMPNGKTLSQEQFFAAYKPIFNEIQRDKAEIKAAPDGQLAQRLSAMNLEQYMAELAARATPPERGLLQKCMDAVTFSSQPKIDPNIFLMSARCYESECGQSANKESAKQFVDEASSELGSMFDSDCAYRVDGGTEQIIHKLHDTLKASGVHFHTNEVATKISHEHGKNAIHFAGHTEPTVSDKVILALPAYKLKEIEGLESLGMTPEQIKLISEAQYTNSIKFTVKLRDGAPTPNSNFFSALGFQCWSDTPGLVTFLASNAGMDRLGATLPQYVQTCMDAYAQGQGTTREAMFGDVRGNMVLTNPISAPCYASPAAHQQRELLEFGHSLNKLEHQGVSIVGTYIPNRTENGTEIGFMECGLKSAERAAEHLVIPQRAPDHWQGIAAKRGQAQQLGA